MATIEERARKAYPENHPCDYECREGFRKACEEYESLPKIHGWVARDSVEDGFIGTGLILHHSKPTRVGGEWSTRTIMAHLPSKLFPEITWKSDPVEVELLIRKV